MMLVQLVCFISICFFAAQTALASDWIMDNSKVLKVHFCDAEATSTEESVTVATMVVPLGQCLSGYATDENYYNHIIHVYKENSDGTIDHGLMYYGTCVEAYEADLSNPNLANAMTGIHVNCQDAFDAGISIAMEILDTIPEIPTDFTGLLVKGYGWNDQDCEDGNENAALSYMTMVENKCFNTYHLWEEYATYYMVYIPNEGLSYGGGACPTSGTAGIDIRSGSGSDGPIDTDYFDSDHCNSLFGEEHSYNFFDTFAPNYKFEYVSPYERSPTAEPTPLTITETTITETDKFIMTDELIVATTMAVLGGATSMFLMVYIITQLNQDKAAAGVSAVPSTELAGISEIDSA